eukprot:gene15663-biopygen13104
MRALAQLFVVQLQHAPRDRGRARGAGAAPRGILMQLRVGAPARWRARGNCPGTPESAGSGNAVPPLRLLPRFSDLGPGPHLRRSDKGTRCFIRDSGMIPVLIRSGEALRKPGQSSIGSIYRLGTSFRDLLRYSSRRRSLRARPSAGSPHTSQPHAKPYCSDSARRRSARGAQKSV